MNIIELRQSTVLGSLVLGWMLASSPVLAEDADGSQPVPGSGWQVDVVSYLWAAGASGTVRTLPPLPPATIDLDFGDTVKSLKDLDAGLIATVFGRKDRLLFMVDVNWMKLSPTQTLDLSGQPVELRTKSETLSLLPAIGYRVLDEGGQKVDVYGGFKFWRMTNSAEVQPAVVTPNRVSVDETWTDLTVGARVRTDLSARSYLDAIAFVGTGGSDYFIDAYLGLGYTISERMNAFVGYRIMNVDRENGDFLYDVKQKGPMFGIALRF
ncbi:hypothetical protein [Tabrizicola sp. BL-A-41-H6]|uniref:hypothetical protein n=1 Tax=Tabrizicola sp. BL-A-41-H6 TaxID=3421107 RepID=UPI003D67D701